MTDERTLIVNTLFVLNSVKLWAILLCFGVAPSKQIDI